MEMVLANLKEKWCDVCFVCMLLMFELKLPNNFYVELFNVQKCIQKICIKFSWCGKQMRLSNSVPENNARQCEEVLRKHTHTYMENGITENNWFGLDRIGNIDRCRIVKARWLANILLKCHIHQKSILHIFGKCWKGIGELDTFALYKTTAKGRKPN